jgi:hypothetical protein
MLRITRVQIAETIANSDRNICGRRLGTTAAVVLAVVAVLSIPLATGSAYASTPSPQWTVTATSRPTNFAPGDKSGENAYIVTLTNSGSAPSDGTPVTIAEELPVGLTLDALGASGEDEYAAVSKPGSEHANFNCLLSTCTYTGAVLPDDTLVLTFPVDVAASPPASCQIPSGATSCVANRVHVHGGGALDAFVSTPTAISLAPASFGVAPGGAATVLSTTQAGAHPDFTTSISFNTVDRKGALAGPIKDTRDELPPGFAGDTVDTPSCTAARFSLSECPIGTQIGVTTVTLTGQLNRPVTEPVYNLAPNPGDVAKLGFLVVGNFGIQGEVTLRPGDYGLTTTFHNTDEAPAEIDNVKLTIWGVPADKSHDPWRWQPEGAPPEGHFGTTSDAARAPFFTNPTACSGELLDATINVNSWELAEDETTMPLGPIAGCDRLTMTPALLAEATTDTAYSATGLNVGLEIPQTYDNADGLATSTLKGAVVALPEGMTVNPSAGAGAGACSQSAFEEEGAQAVAGKGCPNNSKLGTVKIKSPALSEEATGSVFLAEPRNNQFGSLLALYIVARIPNRGIIIRTAGEVKADLATGRLTTTFDDLPPLPFNLFTLSFRQGETSPLVTPANCGGYSVSGEFTPWSSPEAALNIQSLPFSISKGFDGGACPPGGVPPFKPQVLAGTQDNEAGAYSSMYIRVIRGDGEEEITRFSARLPRGLTANLTGVPFCPDANITAARGKTGAQEEEQPSCPADSQIGHTLVGAGVGSVLAYAPGRVYMSGPYNGAPFSIVAITSAKVGPFDLGTVVVREALELDPQTAVVTVDAAASDPIPHIIEGIVVHVRDIRVYIDSKPNFTLNPTNCERMTLLTTVSGSGLDFTSAADDVPVAVGNPFQAADCQTLKFKPSFKVSTSAKTSRINGASLVAKLTYPDAPPGSQANIRSVKVLLPKQLPSRLTTLQKACPAATFNLNPALCPQASRVGSAIANTPILPVPLTGPAYFVSYGGAKFPELVVVLQGYGVTVDLHGETSINEKTGITSSTFRTVPDEPVKTFQLTLPQGKDSALAAIGNLCKIRLAMPTAFTAQNGLVIHRSTPIAVTGCKHKAKPKGDGRHIHAKGGRSSKK